MAMRACLRVLHVDAGCHAMNHHDTMASMELDALVIYIYISIIIHIHYNIINMFPLLIDHFFQMSIKGWPTRDDDNMMIV